MGEIVNNSSQDVLSDREEGAADDSVRALLADIAVLRFPDDPDQQGRFVTGWLAKAGRDRGDPLLAALREEVAVRDRAARVVRLLTAYARAPVGRRRYRWRELAAAQGVSISTVQGHQLDGARREVRQLLGQPD